MNFPAMAPAEPQSEPYRKLILDHSQRPRRFGRLEVASRSALGQNPLCADRLSLQIRLVDGRIAEIAFEGLGCAISIASASMMVEAVDGKSVEEAIELSRQFHGLITGEPAAAGVSTLGKLAALSAVRKYPARIKCATLAWRTLQAALDGADPSIPVTTE